MKKISTIAVPFSGNRGSSSMLFSIIQNLPKEIGDIYFNVFTYYPDKEKQMNPFQNVNVFSGTPINLIFNILPLSFIYFISWKVGLKFPKKLLSNEIRILLDSNLFLAVGGTTFSDHKILKVIFNVLCLLPGMFLNIPIILFTQTMGPFNKRVNKYLAKFILPKAKFIIGRGAGTYKNLKSLGLKNVDYATDAAFALVTNKKETEYIINEYQKIFFNKCCVGISPNSIVEGYCKKHNIDHAKIYGDFINYLIENDYYPVLIPHSMKLKTKNRHNNDIPVIDDILKHVKSVKYLYIKESFSYIELRAIIGMMSFYIASRFHSMISALYMQVPVLVFGWGSQKYKEVMEEYELNDYVFDFEDITLGNLIFGFNKIVEEKESIQKRIKENGEKVKAKAYKAFKIIKLNMN